MRQGRLVDGRKLFCDSSLVRADASLKSIVDTRSFERHLNRACRELTARLSEKDDDGDKPPEGGEPPPRRDEVNRHHVSTTDPEAAVVRKGKGKAQLCYQTHRAVDGAFGVVTRTILGPGDENEAHRLVELVEGHQVNTGLSAETVAADSKYGTKANFLAFHERGVQAHLPPLTDAQEGKGRRGGIYPDSDFSNDPVEDRYICPAGQTLPLRHHWKERSAFEYAAKKKVCRGCEKRSLCTRSQSAGRTIKRHEQQEVLDELHARANSRAARRDIRIRQHFMERSFAEGTRYGLKRARWRGRDRVRIQDFLIAAVQNIRLLITHAKPMPAQVVTLWVNQPPVLPLDPLGFYRLRQIFASFLPVFQISCLNPFGERAPD